MNIAETTTNIRIQAYSIRGLLLAVQHYNDLGFKLDHEKEAINMINTHVCHMTKLSLPDNKLVDWHVTDTTPIVVDVIEQANAPERRKPGRPAKENK